VSSQPETASSLQRPTVASTWPTVSSFTVEQIDSEGIFKSAWTQDGMCSSTSGTISTWSRLSR